MTQASPNKALIRHFYQAINEGDLGVIDELVDTEAIAQVQRSASPAGATGSRSALPPIRRFFSSFRLAFPDAQFTVEDLIEEGDRVVTVVTASGTHLGTPPDGPLANNPATGKSIQMRIVYIDRIADGRIVERWGTTDNLRLMQQLGICHADDQVRNPPSPTS